MYNTLNIFDIDETDLKCIIDQLYIDTQFRSKEQEVKDED